jgi:DNA invertase Pin-like site-specific DNA recombinase
MKKLVALYSRVSTANQDNGLEAQERALESFCKNANIKYYKKFSDKNISGAKESRPQLDLLLQEIENKNISKVIVYSFSRFARSTKHLLNALEMFKKHRVEFISISENIDTSSAIGTAFFTIIGAIAQLERELISERVKNGLRNAIAKGKKVGRPKTRPANAILSLRAEHYSYREIAKMLAISHTAVAREIQSSKCKQTNSS